MAYLSEEETYEEGIYQLELTDKVQGGANGISNLQGKQLANRTKYLKAEVEKRVETSTKGVANGVATLDENARVPYSQLPESAMEFKGTWDADTNTPTLADGTGTNGDFYVVSVAGTQDLGSGNIQFFVNDRIIYNGSVWSRLSAGDVKTVNSITPTNGDVEITGTDIPVETGSAKTLADPVETDRIADNSVTLAKLAFSIGGNVMAKNKRWLRFDFSANNKKTLKILADTHIPVDGTWVDFNEDTSIDLSASVTENGKDYYVFLASNGTVSCSTTKTAPDGTVRIGQFHTLCNDVGSGVTGKVATEETTTGNYYLLKQYDEEEDPDFYAFYNKQITSISTGTYYNVGTVEHALSGFEAQDILPESVWCLSFHPSCANWDGMIYDKDTDKAIDIYLQSGTGKSTKSAYGAVHTVSRQQQNHEDDMRAVGKLLLSDSEFASVALGSNEATNIAGSADASTVGGHSDTASRRMISFVGAEECCGYLWQWLRDVAPTGGSSWANYDGQGSFGQMYGTCYGLFAGGTWDCGTNCGSRCRSSHHVRSYVDTHFGGRGSAGVIRVA